jgi:hypothetical protein
MKIEGRRTTLLSRLLFIYYAISINIPSHYVLENLTLELTRAERMPFKQRREEAP